MQFADSPTYNLQDAHEVVRVHNDLAGDSTSPVVADIRAARVGADRPARHDYTTDVAARQKKAMAMIVPELMSLEGLGQQRIQLLERFLGGDASAEGKRAKPL
jgi:hypothetical protein